MGMRRIAGTGGVLFVALVVITNLAQGAAGRPFGNPDDPGYLSDYLAYYTDGGWIPTLLGFVLPLIWLGLAVFAVGLTSTLLRREWVDGEAWSLLGLVGVVMQNAIFPVVVALDVAQYRFVADEGALDLGLHHAHEVLFGLNSLSLAIALTGFSAAMLRGGTGLRWLPRTGFLGALLLAVSTTNLGIDSAAGLFDAAGLLGFVLWLGFIATAGLWLLRQPSSDPQAAPEPSRLGL